MTAAVDKQPAAARLAAVAAAGYLPTAPTPLGGARPMRRRAKLVGFAPFGGRSLPTHRKWRVPHTCARSEGELIYSLWPRRRRRQLGLHRLADRDLQAQRHRPQAWLADVLSKPVNLWRPRVP